MSLARLFSKRNVSTFGRKMANSGRLVSKISSEVGKVAPLLGLSPQTAAAGQAIGAGAAVGNTVGTVMEGVGKAMR